MEVLIAGGGPAGWSLASACATRGHAVTLVTPPSPWRATYGMWLDETPALPPGAKYVVARARAAGRWLDRRYVVLDNDSVRAGFAHPGITVVSGRAAQLAATRVTLADSRELHAPIVFDATGARRSPGGAEQTAYGVLVPAGAAAHVVGPGEAVFMDWRPTADGPATFLYAVPLPDGRVLLEETCLAGRPALGFGELRDRLHARVGPLDGEVERVRFPVDVRPPSRRATGPVPFGASAGFTHPATGFSLADTFVLAHRAARALTDGQAALRRVMWSGQARLVYRLRRRGLNTLLSLTADEHEEFFDLFFALPADHQRAYLSERANLRGTATTMAALFRSAPTRLRRKMAGL